MTRSAAARSLALFALFALSVCSLVACSDDDGPAASDASVLDTGNASDLPGLQDLGDGGGDRDTSSDVATDAADTDAGTSGDADADGGEPGTIAIYLTGDTREREFDDDLSGQTPSDFFIALSAYHVLTSAGDDAPDLCFDHGDEPVVADLSEDNLMGSCTTSAIPSAVYTHGRVRVDWLKYTVKGTLHHLGSTYDGDIDVFRAYSDTVYEEEEYDAGSGYVEFRGVTTVRVPVTWPAIPDSPGITTEVRDGEMWMTFTYGRPLPIEADDEGSHWARFHWQIFEGFRWREITRADFADGVWDLTSTVVDGEEVVIPGVTGYYITTSLD